MLGLKLNHVSKRGHSKHYVDKYQVRIVSLLSGYLRFLILVLTVGSHQKWLARSRETSRPLQWRYNGRNGVSNHQPHECLLNRLFRRRSRKTSKLRATGLCAGNSPVTGEFPAQWPVTRKMFPFDDVFMSLRLSRHSHSIWRLET